MENQKFQGLESINPFDLEEEYFVLSSEYVTLEDEYVLCREEVNLRQHKNSVKETGIAKYDDEEMIISMEENSYCLEDSYSI